MIDDGTVMMGRGDEGADWGQYGCQEDEAWHLGGSCPSRDHGSFVDSKEESGWVLFVVC